MNEEVYTYPQTNIELEQVYYLKICCDTCQHKISESGKAAVCCQIICINYSGYDAKDERIDV